MGFLLSGCTVIFLKTVFLVSDIPNEPYVVIKGRITAYYASPDLRYYSD